MGLAMASSSSARRVGRKAGAALISRAYHFSMAALLLCAGAHACATGWDLDSYTGGDDLWLFPSILPDTVNGVKDGPDKFYCFRGFKRCMSGIEQCIRLDQECDGVEDCADGSDEGDRCKSFDCNARGRYKCPSGRMCMNVWTATGEHWRYKDLIDPYTQYLCDGVKDCADGSDEDPSFCSSYDCNEDMPHMPLRNSSHLGENLLPYNSPPHRRRCPGGRGGCLVEKKLCDGVVDCVGDGGSDEKDEYCRKRGCSPSSLSSLFQCDSGRCINRQRVCDGKKDCPDGDDEGEFCEHMACSGKSGVTWESCGTNRLTCPLDGNGGMKCPGSSRTCIVESQLCDGVEDCPGGTDEKQCEMHSCSIWPRYLKKCPSGRECAAFHICNGVKECRDGSDEDPDLCRAYNCSSSSHRGPLFKCKDGVTCVAANVVCDGQKNCPDKSDEDPVFCRSHHDCSLANQVRCPGSRYVWCTYPWALCDGLRGSCYEGEDENAAFCASKEARELVAKDARIACLSNDTRFVRGQYCNGKRECEDASDEREDFCQAYRCPEWTVKCYGKWCTRGKRCDGNRDCPDGSDEEGCSTVT